MTDFDPADPQEPMTPKEKAQHDVAYTAYDTLMCIAKLVKLRNESVSRDFVAQELPKLWECKASLDLLISEIKETEDDHLRGLRQRPYGNQKEASRVVALRPLSEARRLLTSRPENVG